MVERHNKPEVEVRYVIWHQVGELIKSPSLPPVSHTPKLFEDDHLLSNKYRLVQTCMRKSSRGEKNDTSMGKAASHRGLAAACLQGYVQGLRQNDDF